MLPKHLKPTLKQTSSILEKKIKKTLSLSSLWFFLLGISFLTSLFISSPVQAQRPEKENSPSQKLQPSSEASQPSQGSQASSLQTTSSSQTSGSQEFRIGISQEFENLNPLIKSMAATNYIYSMVGRSLVTLNPQGQWIPLLAKSIPTLENKGAFFSPDRSKLIAQWEILEEAKWSDGTPVTCADFAFTREVALSPNISIGEKELYSQIESISWDKKTPKSCVFTHSKIKWDFNHMGQFNPLPRHIEEPIFKKYQKQKEGYEKNTIYNKNPTAPGLYNGPYKIVEAKLGSHVTLEPNPHFYGKKPKLSRIVIKLIPNTATLDANLRSQTIDKVSSLGLSFDQALTFNKKVQSEKLPFVVHFKPSITYEHIDLNLDNPILKDKKVRQALIYAINRTELVQALFENKQEVALHHVAPLDPWFTQDPKTITLYPYNKRQASRLLDEAGWILGKNGIREKNNTKLSLVFMTTSGNKTREMVQTFLQQQWKAIGVDIIIKNEPARVLFSETTKSANFLVWSCMLGCPPQKIVLALTWLVNLFPQRKMDGQDKTTLVTVIPI
jgi:peptide/nickel transport system substrate-binding protein